MGNYITLQSIPVILFQCTFLIVTALLVQRVLQPTIITFPWRKTKTKTQDTSNPDKHRNKTVVLAGSYNPPHYGHLAMLSHLSQQYEAVIAVIGMNPNKQYAVSPDERANILKQMIQVYQDADGHVMQNVRVEVISYYIWRYAMKQKASLLFRGVRSWAKDGKEEMQLLALNTWGPIIYGPLKWPLPTIFLEGDPRYNHISSTLIRSLCVEYQKKRKQEEGQEEEEDQSLQDGEELRNVLKGLVPLEVALDVAKAYSK